MVTPFLKDFFCKFMSLQHPVAYKLLKFPIIFYGGKITYIIRVQLNGGILLLKFNTAILGSACPRLLAHVGKLCYILFFLVEQCNLRMCDCKTEALFHFS